MRIQQFVFGNASFKTNGDLYKDEIDDILSEVMTTIRTTITPAFQNVKAQARISKNKDGDKTIYFAVRYEDVDKDKNIYNIINDKLNTVCKLIYDEAVKNAASASSGSNSSSSNGFGAVPVGGSSSSGSTPTQPAPPSIGSGIVPANGSSSGNSTSTPSVPTGTIDGSLYAQHAIVRYTAETVWSDMLEDPMCEVREGNRVNYHVNDNGVSTMTFNMAPIVWSKDKMKMIRKTADVMCNYWMDAPEAITEYLTMNITLKVTDWQKSFTKKDLEHPEWCRDKYLPQLKELVCGYDDMFNMELVINDDYNAFTGSITGVLRVPGAIGDYGIQRRVEDVRTVRQSVKLKDQTEENKYRMLDLDIDLGDGRTLELRTDKNAPSMSKFFYKGGLSVGGGSSGVLPGAPTPEAPKPPKKKWMGGFSKG